MSREYVAIWGEARVPIGDNCGATRTPTQEESSQHHAEVISYEMHKRNRHHNKPATRAERRTRREIELEATRVQILCEANMLPGALQKNSEENQRIS